MGEMKRELGLTALLICPDREIQQRFHASQQQSRNFQVLGEFKSYPSPATLEVRLRQHSPDVVLIDVASDFKTACDLVRFVAAYKPAVHAVGLHRASDSTVLVQVLRAGASEFLFSPFDPAAQKDAVARLRRLRQPETEGVQAQGKMLVVTSSKPGSGGSTLATHLAHAIRRTSGQRVLLIDLDTEGGTVGFFLKLQSATSIVTALQNAERLDANLWSSLVSGSTGVDVLPAPEAPSSEPVDPNRLHEVLEYARILYDYIIVDTPSIFHRSSLLAISEADQTLLISTGDLASLHLTRKAVQLLTQLGLPRDRYQVVVNRVSRRDGIGESDIEKILNCRVYASVPNDYFPLHRVISLGQPLAPDCDLGKSIAALAAKITTPAAKEKRPASAEAKLAS